MNFGVFGDGFMGAGNGDTGIPGAGGGATFRLTIWETYKEYGTPFFIPNSFFVEGNYTYFGDNDYYGQSINAGHISAGFLYRIRLGAAQRFIFGLGTSIGAMVSGFNWNTRYDAEGNLLPVVIIGVYMDLPYAEMSFRFTPAWSLALGLSVSGDIYAFATDNPGIAGLRGRLGLTYRRQR
jgi:hypothetical protein